MVNDPPVEEVLDFKKRGLSDEEIIKTLEDKGFSFKDIDDAISQADIKKGVEGREPEAPLPPSSMAPPNMQESALTHEDVPVPQPSPSRLNVSAPEIVPSPTSPVSPAPYSSSPVQRPELPPSSEEEIQELIESIIDERWQQVIMSVGDINLWKGKVDDELAAIKQEVLRFEQRFDSLQRTMIGKVSDYEKGIKKVGSEMEALEKVFSKIMQPLTANIKDLSRITNELKKR